MAFDWEGILGAEGNDLQSAYDDALERTDQIEADWHRPVYDSAFVTNWFPGDGCPAPEDDGAAALPECDENCPFCAHNCAHCRDCRQCDGTQEACHSACAPCGCGDDCADETEARAEAGASSAPSSCPNEHAKRDFVWTDEEEFER